jgi:flagellar motor protein MotB
MFAPAHRPLLRRSVTTINYWPAVLDLMTSIFMVFVLTTFVQSALNPQDLEALQTRSAQDRFVQLFRRRFSPELEAGTVSIQRGLSYLQITFGDRVLFELNQYTLKPSGEPLLARCADVLVEGRGAGYQQIQIEGHTDDLSLARTEYPTDNWDLSAARALAVLRFLSVGRGLRPEVFSANGYADHRPVQSNATEAGRARNRRIEIRLLFSIGPREPTP